MQIAFQILVMVRLWKKPRRAPKASASFNPETVFQLQNFADRFGAHRARIPVRRCSEELPCGARAHRPGLMRRLDVVPLEFILICVRGPINTEGLVRDLRSATNGSCNRSGFSPKFHCVKERLLKIFEGWCDNVIDLMLATDDEAILRRDIYDRTPTFTWGRSRVTLLGDLVHAMQPNMGQGGCMAIEVVDSEVSNAYHVG
ncbi:hypothetical protein WN943_007130 [Citrus x changshan-huyou]